VLPLVIAHLILGLLSNTSLYAMLLMNLSIHLLCFLFSISFVCGAKVHVKMDTSLPVDPSVIGGPWASNPCLNNMHCIPASHTNIGYFCHCSIGFYDINCTETDVALTLELINIGNDNVTTLPTAFETASQVDPICVANPCENTGKCIPDKSTNTGFVCLCSQGWAGQTCKEKIPGSSACHLRLESSEEDNLESCNLRSGEPKWTCQKYGYAIVSVSIWWGHNTNAAAWACNNWISFCGGSCTTSQNKLAESSWYCYGLDPMIYVGQANIWFGHSKGDASWACNMWMPNCQKYGGCVTKHVWYSDSWTRYNSYIKCSGTGGVCYVFDKISLNRFDGDGTDEKVWGCGGGFHLSGASLKGTIEKEPSAEIILSFSQSDSFYGWEGCCTVAGKALQSRGYLSDGWYCEKVPFVTGIWLKGKAHWL